MSDIQHIPIDVLMNEKRSQKDRLLKEVMDKLYEITGGATFELESGAKCSVVKFSPPKQYDDGLQYGFDVRIDKGGIDHLEFFVKCTGFGGSV